jgi:ferric-dicitrate binding protein FerR (iron transport regulator)
MISSRINSEAARWLIELDSAEDTERLWPEFESWLQRDPEHRRAYVRTERAWRALGELRSVPSTETSNGKVPAAALGTNPNSTRRKPLPPTTIVIVIAVVILALLAFLGYT